MAKPLSVLESGFFRMFYIEHVSLVARIHLFAAIIVDCASDTVGQLGTDGRTDFPPTLGRSILVRFWRRQIAAQGRIASSSGLQKNHLYSSFSAALAWGAPTRSEGFPPVGQFQTITHT